AEEALFALGGAHARIARHMEREAQAVEARARGTLLVVDAHRSIGLGRYADVVRAASVAAVGRLFAACAVGMTTKALVADVGAALHEIGARHPVVDRIHARMVHTSARRADRGRIAHRADGQRGRSEAHALVADHALLAVRRGIARAAARTRIDA